MNRRQFLKSLLETGALAVLPTLPQAKYAFVSINYQDKMISVGEGNHTISEVYQFLAKTMDAETSLLSAPSKFEASDVDVVDFWEL